jgi:hypothetical protein
MSPRTRNLPRENAYSLRSYWISTSLVYAVAVDALPALERDHQP